MIEPCPDNKRTSSLVLVDLESSLKINSVFIEERAHHESGKETYLAL